MAAPPAVGSEAISAPMNGPERSTTTEAATTMLAVIAILSKRPIRNVASAVMVVSPRRAGVQKTAADCSRPKRQA